METRVAGLVSGDNRRILSDGYFERTEQCSVPTHNRKPFGEWTTLPPLLDPGMQSRYTINEVLRI